jgi:hypothetical protein
MAIFGNYGHEPHDAWVTGGQITIYYRGEGQILGGRREANKEK